MFGCISDEVGQDVESILNASDNLNLKYLEPRVIDGQNIADTPNKTLEKLATGLRNQNVQVPCIASPLLKTALRGGPDDPEEYDSFDAEFTLEEQRYLADRMGRIAGIFGSPRVRVFSGWSRPQLEWKSVLADQLKIVVSQLVDHGVKPVLEIDHMCNIETYSDYHRLPGSVTDELGVLFDTGNYILSGNSDVLSEIKRFGDTVSHIHLKDATIDGCVPLGEGMVPVGSVLEYAINELSCPVTIETYATETSPEIALKKARESLYGGF